MKLHEYQARDILERYRHPRHRRWCGIHAGGSAARSPKSIGGKVVVKAQVLVGGRGKAGGVKLADTPEQAEEVARQILGMDIKGLTVEKVLVAEAITYEREIYLSVILDRATKRIVMIASAEGGVEIEEVAKTNPDAIKKIAADPMLGLQQFQAMQLAFDIGLPMASRRASSPLSRARSFASSSSSTLRWSRSTRW